MVVAGQRFRPRAGHLLVPLTEHGAPCRAKAVWCGWANRIRDLSQLRHLHRVSERRGYGYVRAMRASCEVRLCSMVPPLVSRRVRCADQNGSGKRREQNPRFRADKSLYLMPVRQFFAVTESEFVGGYQSIAASGTAPAKKF